MQKKSILPAILGNANEWYDFALYGYFSPIFAQLFFPKSEHSIALLLTFAIFATGFIVRPIGAMIFGHIGDRLGRRKALLITTVLMALPTACIGLLPTYQSVGILAPLLLVLLRLIQGLAVSGELSGASAYIIEHAKPKRRGLAGSLIMASVYSGQLIGSAIGMTISWLVTQQQLMAWGWRIPFFLSLVFGIGILWLRLRSDETPKFEEHRENKQLHDAPVKVALSQHIKSITQIVGFICIAAVSGYILIGFLPTFLTLNHGFSLHTALALNTIGMVVVMLLIPVVGYLSDHFGRKLFLLIGTIGFILLAYPMFYLFSQHSFGLALIAEIIYCVCIACINGVTTVTMAEMFPTDVRQTGTGIGFNVSLAVFGGTAPLVAQFLINLFHTHFAASYYLILCGLISLPFIIKLSASHQQPLR
tara:strand:- start:34329 stop:35585 length:1257 start_codon:yes stop_codon:yes gene_type:complete